MTVAGLFPYLRGRQTFPRYHREDSRRSPNGYNPSFFPWFVTAEEARFLTLALEQAVEIASRMEENPGLLDPLRKGLYLVRTLVRRGENLVWEAGVGRCVGQSAGGLRQNDPPLWQPAGGGGRGPRAGLPSVGAGDLQAGHPADSEAPAAGIGAGAGGCCILILILLTQAALRRLIQELPQRSMIWPG